jgi:hypothetical protein
MLIKFKSPSGTEQQLFAFADTHGNHRRVIVPDGVETVHFLLGELYLHHAVLPVVFEIYSSLCEKPVLSCTFTENLDKI